MDNMSKSVKNSDVLVIYFPSFLRFLCGPVLIFIEFVTILLLFHVSFFWPWGKWDLSSLTRDWTHTATLEDEILTTGPPGKSHILFHSKRWCCESATLNMPANLENSAVATGLEKDNVHSNPKERQCQRMFKLLQNWTHLTR